MIDIWQIGNTGVRNPMRIQAALRVYAESSLVGNIRGEDGSVAFMKLLDRKGVLSNEPGRDSSGSYGRKFRYEFNENGFTFDKLHAPLRQAEFGDVDALTPFGKAFLEADTVPAMQEFFLRANSVPMRVLPDGKTFSPLRWTLAILLELERRGNAAELGFVEFATLVQTSNPAVELGDVVDRILELRRRRLESSAKKRFDAQWYSRVGQDYRGKVGNFRDYGDMNLRYLRATGMVRSKGHGIALMVEKRGMAEKLAATQIFDTPIEERYRQRYEGPRLPTDDIDVAMGVLSEIESLVQRSGIACDLDRSALHTVADVNAARYRLEELLSRQAEEAYAKDQKNQWREIVDYMELVMRGGGTKQYDDEREIKVPREEASAYLEWCLWRAFLAINTLRNKSYEVRRFKVDQDFFPVATAPGNGADLVAVYDNDVIAIEVTLSGGSRQEAMEGEPVRRHVADLVHEHPSKKVHGLFVANKVDTNTVETFRHGIWYDRSDVCMNLDIVPVTLGQFKDYFVSMFETGCHSGSEVTVLIARCGCGRERYDAPTWKRMIGNGVDAAVADLRQVCGSRYGNSQFREDFLQAAGIREATIEGEYPATEEGGEVIG